MIGDLPLVVGCEELAFGKGIVVNRDDDDLSGDNCNDGTDVEGSAADD